MRRRIFFRSLGITAAVLVVAPRLLAEEAIPDIYDAIPLKAQAQEIIGNRLIYGNYSDHLRVTAITTKCEDGVLEIEMFKKRYLLFPGQEYQFFIFGRDFSAHKSSVYGDTIIHSLYKGTAINSQTLKLSDSVFQNNSNIRAGDYLIIKRI